jgi:hypothetical protein
LFIALSLMQLMVCDAAAASSTASHFYSFFTLMIQACSANHHSAAKPMLRQRI